MRAKIKRVVVEVFVPFPDNIVDEIAAENAAVKEAISPFQNFVLQVIRAQDHPKAISFVDSMSVDDIRKEMARKVKKIGLGLSGQFPVHERIDDRGVLFWATASEGSRD